MRRLLAWVLSLSIALTGCRDGAPKPQSSPAPSESVTLQASHEAGIPLHPSPTDSRVSGRVADGSVAIVVERTPDGRWLHVRVGEQSGWITRRYVKGADAGVRPVKKPSPGSPWSSPAECEKALSALGERARTVTRVATWNIRWFPDGKPGKGRADDEGTDVRWLACAIAWLDVDAVALQEIKTNAHAKERSRALLEELDRHTKGKWRLETDDCPNRHGQHVAILVDEKKLELTKLMTLGSLNANGEPCKNQLRPGLSAYVKTKAGVDFHLVSVHMKSGGERRSLDLRHKALLGITEAESELFRVVPDRDVVIAGDFNTMGCNECATKVSAEEEIAATDRTLGALPTPFRRVPTDGECTERSSHGAALLDHFVVSRSMTEVGPAVRAGVAGLCRESACRGPRGAPAETRLSDHCPVVLEMDSRDLD